MPWKRGHGHGQHAGRGGCDHQARYADGDGEGWGPGHGRGQGGRMAGRMLAMIDSNGDGVIGDDEAASRVEGVFLAMDGDSNGEVTLDEYMAVRMGPGEGRNPERMKAMQEAKTQRFEAMDTDKDGKVTKAQFLEAAKTRFAAADTDKDGKVTPWEFRAQHNPIN
jgi:Ca2+-binding EF-hand superfamily protein